MKKPLFFLAFLFVFPFNSAPGFAQDSGQIIAEETIPEYIAEAQWATVEKLQKLLEEKNYQQALLCFSEKIRERIKIVQDKDPNFLIYFFEQWTLNEEAKKNYKDSVFKGKSYFIYDLNEQEWKINEN